MKVKLPASILQIYPIARIETIFLTLSPANYTCTMVTYSKAASENDLKGILDLQKKNLARRLTDDEIQRQGFVTVNHSYDQLKRMNDHEQHVIAKENDRVVAYILAMTKHSRNDIPILIPMFGVFDQIEFSNKRVSEFNYLVVGQVSVDKQHRGMGIFDKCYQFYKECYQSKYDFAITEIAVRNERSLNAHKRVGFEVIHSYQDPENTDWKVVAWNWKS